MKKQLLAFLILSALQFPLFSQVECGNEDALRKLNNEFPGATEQFDRTFQHALDLAEARIARRNNFAFDTVYVVPVVFHVLWDNAAERLEDSMLISQLEVLNEDFRRKNADTVLTRDVFKDRAGDVRIEFRFAEVDPNGNPTNGINKVETTRSTFYDRARSDLMKYTSTGGVDAWDPQRYVNIWVCDYSVPNFGPLILGYAFPPRGARNWTSQTSNVPDARQGVVIHYQVVGRYNNRANTATLRLATGRTGTHELGHYFGLRHIWGDGNNTTGCSVDDFIDDTPNSRAQNGYSQQCNTSKNTCFEIEDDLPDMTENYMDYSSGFCQNMFTTLQANLMRTNLIYLRPNLADSIRVTKNEEYVPEGIRVYPNPFSEELLVELGVEGLTTVKLYSGLGQLVLQKELAIGEHSLSTAFLAPGVYHIYIQDENGEEVYVEKLVKY